MEEIIAWRFEQLVGSGYPIDQAGLVACRRDIDLHQALELVMRGCPHELALSILL